MQAKVTKAFRGVPEGEIYPKKFAPGDIIDGSLARSMVDAGFAKKMRDGAPENKALGGAPENKAFREPVARKTRSSTRKRSKPKSK